LPAETAESADIFQRHLRFLQEKLIYNRIHSKGKHQQGVAVALVIKDFMWIIGNHCCQRYKNPELVQGSDSIFAK